MSTPIEEEDPLERYWNDQEAIKLIKELYQVDDEIATDLWHRFIGTVRRMRAISRRMRESER